MATIANDTQFIGISPTIDLTGKKSAILNEQTIPVTMEDITSTVRPYKVFTALLTQSGGDDVQFMNDDIFLVKGVTYDIVANDVPNFNFVPYGAPNNNNGTKFIANQTISFIGIVDCALSYNTGAPVATVLENTIGNIWFTYNDVGSYIGHLNNGFPTNKMYYIKNLRIGASDESSWLNTTFYNENEVYLVTSDGVGENFNNYLNNTPIEIRVYE